MATLQALVDFDNVDSRLRVAGPVALAKSVLSLVPTPVLGKHATVNFRLYGGWRSGGNLTTSAQNLIPDIRASSPANFSFLDGATRANLRMTVELADKPLGGSSPFNDTFVRERSLRKFRARRTPWNGCLGSGCGFDNFARMSSDHSCNSEGCQVRLIDILVRDEQKMVDTLMVADIARAALIDRCSDIVIASSDTDMWPGLMLALGAGCYVTHVHTRRGGATQRHLLRTIDGPLSHFYQQTCL